jgi:glycosyltransferase involved in cell wall biosynthesis
VKISAQMIVFNAATVLPSGMMRACIESILPHVSQLTIVEGATKASNGHRFDGHGELFTTNGCSTDNTLEVLMDIPNDHHKITIVPCDGQLWPGKTYMMNKANEYCSGDYVWQIDSDEFYHEKEIPSIIQMLEKHEPDAVHFFANHFWGGYNDIVPFSERRWGNDIAWRRIFKRTEGSNWQSHEPPEYQSCDGRFMNQGHVLSREFMLNNGCSMYHYGFAQRQQAEFKQKFYNNPRYLNCWDAWQKDKLTPIINGAHTKPFDGSHPKAIRKLIV